MRIRRHFATYILRGLLADLATVASIMDRFVRQYDAWLHYVAPALLTRLKLVVEKDLELFFPFEIIDSLWFCHIKMGNLVLDHLTTMFEISFCMSPNKNLS